MSVYAPFSVIPDKVRRAGHFHVLILLLFNRVRVRMNT